MNLREKRKSPTEDIEASPTPDPSAEQILKLQALTELSMLVTPNQLIKDAIVKYNNMQNIINKCFNIFAFNFLGNVPTQDQINFIETSCIQLAATLEADLQNNSSQKIFFLEMVKKLREAKAQKESNIFPKLLLCAASAMLNLQYQATQPNDICLMYAFDKLKKQMDDIKSTSALQETLNTTQLAVNEHENALNLLMDLRNIQLCLMYIYFHSLYYPNKTNELDKYPGINDLFDYFNIQADFENILKNNSDPNYLKKIQENKFTTYIHLTMFKLQKIVDETFNDLSTSFQSLSDIFKNTEKNIRDEQYVLLRQSEHQQPAEKKLKLTHESSLQSQVVTYVNCPIKHKFDMIPDPQPNYQVLELNVLMPFILSLSLLSQPSDPSSIPHITRAAFLNIIDQCAGKELTAWFTSAFGIPQSLTPTTYAFTDFIVDYPNDRSPETPFKIHYRVTGSDHFTLQKEWGDTEGQSWVFTNEQDIEVFTQNQYVPVPKVGHIPRFITVTAWQIQDAKNEVKAGKNEILRVWFSHCQQMAELKDIAKGTSNTNPIPGVCVLAASHDLFRLFKPKKIVFADSSSKRKGLLTRVWNAIKSSQTYYQQHQALFAQGPYPLQVSLFEHKHPHNKDQDSHIYQYFLGKIQQFPLADFFEILNPTQQNKLLEIYRVCVENKVKNIHSKKKPSSEFDFQTNPYALKYSTQNYFNNNKINSNLQDLVKAVDDYVLKNPKSSFDTDLLKLICDGISLKFENCSTNNAQEKGLKNFLSQQFMHWVYEIVWGGYYWQLTPTQTPKDSKEAKEEPKGPALQ